MLDPPQRVKQLNVEIVRSARQGGLFRMTAFVKRDLLRDLPEAASEKRIRGRLYCSEGNRATIIPHRLGTGDRRRGRADWNRGSRANLSTVRELELSRVVGLLRGERL